MLLTLLLAMIGYVVAIVFTAGVVQTLLASIFPLFNFKDEFIEYWTKRHGSPPSRRTLRRNAYGIRNFFFSWFKSPVNNLSRTNIL